MSFTMNPLAVPDRDSLPLKKRDQRPSSPPQPQQVPCDSAHFKVPYPYKTKHTGPIQPVPRRAPALYQPWMQTHTSSRSKPHAISPFREHHGWAEWRDFNPLHHGWDFSHPYQHQSHLSALYQGHPQYTSRFNPASLVAEGFQGPGFGWERTLRDKSLNPDMQSYGRNKSPYARRGDRKTNFFAKVDKQSQPSLTRCLPHSPHDNFKLQHDSLNHKSTTCDKNSTTRHSFIRVSSDASSTSVKRETSRSPAAPCSKQASVSPNHFPWLLPHFVAGSLIELRDGRLRRVEHLQTEDFLLGSLACPDLRLSCCTVQNISPSVSSSSISRILILLHEQQSQEMVDVYVEYPFFVRGLGWSSCSPQRTARLCGLQCRQLSVGDVCLALTPSSAPQTVPSATLQQEISPKMSEKECEPREPKQTALCTHMAPGQRKMELEAVRRRHSSAPELRGPGTNCMY